MPGQLCCCARAILGGVITINKKPGRRDAGLLPSWRVRFFSPARSHTQHVRMNALPEGARAFVQPRRRVRRTDVYRA